MSRQMWWFILNLLSWLIALGSIIYTVISFEGAETVMQQIAAGAYGSALLLFAIFLRLQATGIRPYTLSEKPLTRTTNSEDIRKDLPPSSWA